MKKSIAPSIILLLIASLTLAACGGGGGEGSNNSTIQSSSSMSSANSSSTNSISSSSSASTYNVFANISGYNGGNVPIGLTVNGNNRLISENGSVRLLTGVATGTTYEIVVNQHPPGRLCRVTKGSGKIAAADVTDIQVVCERSFDVSGDVSGLGSGSFLLDVNGQEIQVFKNGYTELLPRVVTGTDFTVTIKQQPLSYRCAVNSGSGRVADADISIAITCTLLRISLQFSNPDSDTAYFAVNRTHKLQVTFADTSADRLTWDVLPAGMAAKVSITPSSSTATTAEINFSASEIGNYTVRVTSQEDTSKVVMLDARVHRDFVAADSYHQSAVYLQADGTAVGYFLNESKMPSGVFKAVAQSISYSFGVKTDGTVWKWKKLSPDATQVAGVSNVKSLAAGSVYAVAIKEDNSIIAWNVDTDALLTLPPALVNTQFISVDAPSGYLVGVEQNGSPHIWAANTGISETIPSNWQDKNFTQVCATFIHAFALDDSGQVLYWNPSLTDDLELNTLPTTSDEVVKIFCGAGQLALLQADGRVLIRSVTDDLPFGADVDANGVFFDSNNVEGFPKVNQVNLMTKYFPHFVTEGGLIIDKDMNVMDPVAGPFGF